MDLKGSTPHYTYVDMHTSKAKPCSQVTSTVYPNEEGIGGKLAHVSAVGPSDGFILYRRTAIWRGMKITEKQQKLHHCVAPGGSTTFSAPASLFARNILPANCFEFQAPSVRWYYLLFERVLFQEECEIALQTVLEVGCCPFRIVSRVSWLLWKSQNPGPGTSNATIRRI